VIERELPPVSLADIRLEELTEGKWRVVDRRFRETNPRALLGFIERSGESFETMDLRRSAEPIRYDTREAAVAAFAAVVAAPSVSARPFSLDTAGEYRY
jgi:hypothetical protein